MNRRLGIAIAGLAGLATIVVGAAGSASAIGGERGILLIHGPGSVFAGTDATDTAEGGPGGVASFAIEVRNTGTVTSQYLLQVSAGDQSCDPSGCPTAAVAVKAGSLVVTSSATGAGYFTQPVAPGATTSISMKVTIPKTAVPTDDYIFDVNLDDTLGRSLDAVAALTEVTATKGTADDDVFVTTSGQKSVSPNPVLGGAVAVNMKAGGVAKYTVKLVNDSNTVDQILLRAFPDGSCDNGFPIDVSLGKSDITQYVTADGYLTQGLSKGQSVTYDVTITYASAAYCSYPPTAGEWTLHTSVGSHSEDVLIALNAAAT